MPWVRIDDDWYQHPKVIAAGLRGRALWLSAACWASANNTRGLVPDSALPLLAGAADAGPHVPAARRLVAVELWHAAGDQCDDPTCPAATVPVPAGHWAFHGWWQYQLTDEQRAERSAKARASAQARWNKHANSNAKRMRNAVRQEYDTLCASDALSRTPKDQPLAPAPPDAAKASSKLRAADLLWDALMAACGIDGPVTPSARGAYNRAVADLRGVEATPDEIQARAEAYRKRFPDAALTPTALTKHWAELNGHVKVNTSGAPGRPREFYVANGEPIDHAKALEQMRALRRDT